MFISRKVQRNFNACGNGNPPTSGEKEFLSLSGDKYAGEYLLDPQTRRLKVRFFITLAAVTAIAGIYLGIVINAYVRETMVRSVANANAYHMEIFLAPMIQNNGGGDILAPDATVALDRILTTASSGRRLEVLRIWQQDGTIAYSTNKAEVGTRQPNPELTAAFQGHDVAYLGQLSEHGDVIQDEVRKPLLEAYFPLRQEGSDDIIAVGEFYEDATELGDRIDAVRIRTWSMIALASTVTMSLLFIAAQHTGAGLRSIRVQLAKRLYRERELARQNAKLRRAAEQARLSAIVTNENLLAKIGSDIHDGPIQILTLLMMKLTYQRGGYEKPERDAGEIALAKQLLRELRDIAQGLVLPELEGSNAHDAIMLAVSKHENLSGTRVDIALESLPDDLEHAQITCLYRVVQECLSNAYRHAGGAAQFVQARIDDGCIEVRVSDGGPGFSQEPSKDYMGLGMAGLTKRLEMLGGSLSVTSVPNKGTVVAARLPV